MRSGLTSQQCFYAAVAVDHLNRHAQPDLRHLPCTNHVPLHPDCPIFLLRRLAQLSSDPADRVVPFIVGDFRFGIAEADDGQARFAISEKGGRRRTYATRWLTLVELEYVYQWLQANGVTLQYVRPPPQLEPPPAYEEENAGFVGVVEQDHPESPVNHPAPPVSSTPPSPPPPAEPTRPRLLQRAALFFRAAKSYYSSCPTLETLAMAASSFVVGFCLAPFLPLLAAGGAPVLAVATVSAARSLDARALLKGFDAGHAGVHLARRLVDFRASSDMRRTT